MSLPELLNSIGSIILLPLCMCCSVPEKIKKWLPFLIALLITPAIFLSHLETIWPAWSMISNYAAVLIILIMIAIFTKNKLINVFSGILGYILTIVLNNLCLIFLDVIFDIDVERIENDPCVILIFYAAFFSMTALVCRILAHLIRRFDFSIIKKYGILKLILAEISTCCIILVFNISYGAYIGFTSEIIYFNCTLFVLYFLLSIALIHKISRSAKQAFLAEEKELYYKELEEYMKIVDKNIHETRKFRHDYMNILFTMSSYIQAGNIDELEKFFNENILSTKEQICDNTIDSYKQ